MSRLSEQAHLRTQLICSNEMLALAAKHNIHPVIDQVLPMKEAGKAIEAVKNNKVRYRFVLKQDLA